MPDAAQTNIARTNIAPSDVIVEIDGLSRGLRQAGKLSST